MTDSGLQLALERLAPANWERFERFASEFLVTELPELRTVASAGGDGGPDAELFSAFLFRYLTLGPARSRLPKVMVRSLPVILDPRLVRFLTPDLLAEASRIREEARALPERVTREEFATTWTQHGAAWDR